MGSIDAASRMSKGFLKPDSETAKSIEANKANIKQYTDAVSGAPVEPKAPPAAEDYDHINKKAKFGDRPGEKRPGPDGLPVYHKGVASVPKTGPAVLKKGEAVIPAEKNPMNPDNSGMYDKIPGMAKPTKKVLDHVRIRKAKSGGHIIEHHHSSGHKMEEHLAPTMDHVHNHLEQTLGSPNPGEKTPGTPGANVPGAGPLLQVAGGEGAEDGAE